MPRKRIRTIVVAGIAALVASALIWHLYRNSLVKHQYEVIEAFRQKGAHLDMGQVKHQLFGWTVFSSDVPIRIDARDLEITDEDCRQIYSLENGLRELNLSGTAITDDGVQSICRLEGLRVLHLTGTAVTDVAAMHISGEDGLSELGLGHTAISDKSLEYIGVLPSLTRLSLEGAKITGAGLSSLAKMPSLEELFLDGSSINDIGIAAISRSTSIRRLDLRNTNVTDEGVSHLKKMQSLRRVDVSYTGISESAFDDLAAIPVLMTLTCYGDMFDASQIAKLEEMLPNCIVTHDLSGD